MDLAAVESALDALDALEIEGARSFDGPACDCIRTLLTQAERLAGAVGERLSLRAEVHLSALAARLHENRTRVHALLCAHEALSLEPMPELHAQLASGDVIRVARTLRRLRARPTPRPRAPGMTLALREAGPSAWSAPRYRGKVRQTQALAYEDSVAELVASFALARATDVVPEGAGPYNALRIASETLDRMRAISPFYLTVQLNRLEELASLLALPELPAAEPPVGPRTQPRKKRKSPKGDK